MDSADQLRVEAPYPIYGGHRRLLRDGSLVIPLRVRRLIRDTALPPPLPSGRICRYHPAGMTGRDSTSSKIIYGVDDRPPTGRISAHNAS
ncbi:MAG: hypothetical protein IID37_15180 [Planctomycetes bacterium]|nr:hypothetical protein [Planctomycetota bacterium]